MIMSYPLWQPDVVGSGLWIILIAVFLIVIAHFAAGGGLFLMLAERKAERDNDPAILDYVCRHVRWLLVLTMVAGSITGVGIWWTIALLQPAATSILIRTFVVVWAAEWIFFLLGVAALFLSVSPFGRMELRRHRVLGWIAFGAIWMSLFLLNGIVDVMLPPGDWVDTDSRWSAFCHPSFWSSLLFRVLLALFIAGQFGLLTTTWLKDGRLRTVMVRFSTRWLLFALPLLLAAAWWDRSALPPELPEMLRNCTHSMRLGIDGFLFGAPLLVLGALLMMPRLPTGLAKIFALILMVVGSLSIGCVEFIREGGGRPDLIRSVMYSTSMLHQETFRWQTQGLLNNARWVRHRAINEHKKLAAGRELYNRLCLPCHSIGGPVRDIKPLTVPFTPSGLAAMLSGMEMFHPGTPPFAGTAEEQTALADYIARGLNGRSDPAPAPFDKQPATLPPFAQQRDRFMLLAWSTRGMHTVAEVEGLLSLLPPGNSLRAQLIRRGKRPEIVNQGVLLTYRVDSFRAGTNRPSALKGEMVVDEDLFLADDLVLSPAARPDLVPYPVVTIEARDENETLLATTKVVLPVSAEMGCSNCHGGQTGDRVGLTRVTALNILQRHDRLSHTRLLAIARDGQTIRCQSCHADSLVKAAGDPSRLNLSTAIHGFHAGFLRVKGADACAFCHPSPPTATASTLRDIHATIGMACTHCHGTMEDHALGLLRQEHQAGKTQAAVLMSHLRPWAEPRVDLIKPRNPWSNQPDCLHCHVDFQTPHTDTLGNSWTRDASELFRSRTDDGGRLMCAACHSSPHALYPADNQLGAQLDVLQPLQYQHNRLPLGANRNCAVCHMVAMTEEMHHANSLREFRNE
jgi:hypothetical protein